MRQGHGDGLTALELAAAICLVLVCIGVAIPFLLRQRNAHYANLAATTPGLVFTLEVRPAKPAFQVGEEILLHAELRNTSPEDLTIPLCPEGYWLLENSRGIGSKGHRFSESTPWIRIDPFPVGSGMEYVEIPAHSAMYIEIGAQIAGEEMVGEHVWAVRLRPMECPGGGLSLLLRDPPDGYYVVSDSFTFEVVPIPPDAEWDIRWGSRPGRRDFAFGSRLAPAEA